MITLEKYNEQINVLRRNLLTKIGEITAYPSWSDEFCRKEVKEIQIKLLDFLTEKLPTPDKVPGMTKDVVIDLGFIKWNEELFLIPLWLVPYLDPESQVISISDEVTSLSMADNDHRMGMIAYGFKLSA